MNKHLTSDSDPTISRLRSAARTGNLRALLGELTTICAEITVTQCSKLAQLMPRLSVATARASVKTDE